MAQRWDRERFERARGGGPERDYYRFEEREQLGPRGRQELMVDERIDHRGPRGRVEERERFIEEERYAPPSRRAPGFLDDPVAPEANRQALAPYRRPRPQFLRRQSSLDTFDRRPAAPRYGDEYRLPSDVPIPLPIRRPASPARGRYFEEFEERYHDSDEDYRDVRVQKERKGNHRSKSRMRSRSVMRRRASSTSSESSFEEVDKSSVIGRKGRTKLPKRLAHKSAVIELGYPFVEEDNFIVVQRALDKHHIDKIVEISKKYKQEKITYKYEGGKEEVKKEEKIVEKVERIETTEGKPTHHAHHAPHGHHEHHAHPAPPPPPAAPPVVVVPKPHHPPVVSIPAGGELIKTTKTTTTVIDPPDHHHRHQDLILPGHRLSEHDIRHEIQQLEAERRALKLERAADWRLERADRIRDGEWELVEHSHNRPKEVYRVERNRKGRMALVRSAH